MKKRINVLMAMVLWLFSCTPSFAEAADRLQQLLGDLKSWQARFEQQVLNERGVLQQRTQGSFSLQRPGKFRWQVDAPYLQLMVADGQSLWMYDIELEQVTVQTLDTALGNTPALLLSSSVQNLDKSFNVRLLSGKPGIDERFELIPKDKSNHFERVELHFRSDQLSVMQLNDNLGQKTRVTFTQSQRNGPLDSKLFQFTPKPGLDVIDSRN